MNLSKQLRQYRRSHEVTEQQLAEELGYAHASAICRLEQKRELKPEIFGEAMAAIDVIVKRRDLREVG